MTGLLRPAFCGARNDGPGSSLRAERSNLEKVILEIILSNDYVHFMLKQEFHILNALRGLSVLFVIFYHFFVFFFSHQTMSAGLLQIDPKDLVEPFYLQMLGDFPFNIGHFGVAFFFLISGFLIQPSLERYPSLWSYLTHKIFRLWPSYAICFLMGLLFVVAFSLLRGSEFPYTADHLFAYFFWMRDIFHYSFIDGAVWSLEIQVKFYLFAGIIWSFCRKNFLEKFVFITLFLSFFVYGLYTFFDGEDASWFYFVTLARRNLKYFILILLGTCLYAFYKKQISWQKGVGLSSLLLVSFVSPLFNAPEVAKIISYLSAFFIFSYLILFHAKGFGHKGVCHKFIKWASDISYPLYIGHVLPGYVMMFYAIEQGLSVYWGIFAALVYVFVMADIVHKKVEVSFLRMSNALSSRIYFGISLLKRS